MHRQSERRGRLGEGLLLAAVLGLALLLALGSGMNRLLRVETVAPVHCVDAEALREAEMVKLNSATVEELMTLPGVGEVLAGRIVGYREEHGPFASVEELKNVPGIGEGKLNAIRELVFVE